jgi:hypothetical protein
MTYDDKIAMAQFGITNEQKTIFTFQVRVHKRLADALDYVQYSVDVVTTLGSDEKR